MFFYFIIKKKFGFKTVLLNLNLLSIEGTMMLHSNVTIPPHLEYHIKNFRNCLNHQHKIIRFISETENESSILFIYIKRTKGNNLFTTSVYCKTPISRVFTNFGSFIPKSYKYILLFTLSLRSFKICSVLNFFSSGNWQA